MQSLDLSYNHINAINFIEGINKNIKCITFNIRFIQKYYKLNYKPKLITECLLIAYLTKLHQLYMLCHIIDH